MILDEKKRNNAEDMEIIKIFNKIYINSKVSGDAKSTLESTTS